MKIAITYNLKKKNYGKKKPSDFYSEFDSYKTVDSIARALKEKGHKVSLIEVDRNLLSRLVHKRKEIDFVFNIAEGMGGISRESQVPAILDFLGIPYTGSGVSALALALDKNYTKKIFEAENIPTPRFQLFSAANQELYPDLKFPLIVKPNSEGSAKGIHSSSVVENTRDLYQKIKKIIWQYHQSVIVEEFIEGREFTVGVVGNGRLRALPILEVDFNSCHGSGEFFYSWRMKEFQGDAKRHLTPTFYCPARLKTPLAERIAYFALKVHKILGCEDISRTDFRLDKSGRPYVLEVNPLPGLDPEESNFTLMAKAAGIKYTDLISRILEAAVARNKGKNWRGGIR